MTLSINIEFQPNESIRWKQMIYFTGI